MIKNIITGILILNLISSTSIIPLTTNEKQQQNSLLLEDSPGVQWTKLYGTFDWTDHIYQARLTSDGGYILIGSTQSYNSNHYFDAWVIKTDAVGNEIWNKTYNHFESFGESIQQTIDGGYIFCGVFLSDMWLVKINAQGDIQWEKTFNGTRADCVQQVSDGGYILTGYIGYGACLIRTDTEGNLLWEKIYFPLNYSFGWCTLQTSDGGFILTGDTIYYGNTEYAKNYLLKTDQNGNEIWNKSYWNSAEVSRIYSVQQTQDHGYILAGTITSIPWIVRTDENGVELWNRTFSNDLSIAYEIVQTNDGGFILIANNAHAYSCIIKTDANGTTEWELPIGSQTELTGVELTSIQQTLDRGYIVAGIYIDSGFTNGLLMKIGHVPSITITKPINGLYLFDRKILNFFTPLVIGPITIEVVVSDTLYDIDRVEFFVDDSLRYTDTTALYNWHWTTMSFFKHTITITVYNTMGNFSSATINIRKIF
jgi:hypothetical protein